MQNKDSYPTIKDFVLQQAHEKAFEIGVIGLKDYEKQKQKLFDDRKQIIIKQYDKKIKQNTATKRIHRSSLINNSRLQKMLSRHKNLESIILSTEAELAWNIVKDQKQYKPLLKKLIVEGMIKMLQPIILVRCLPRDKEQVAAVINDCKKQFKQLIVSQGLDHSLGEVDLRVDDLYSLEEKMVGNTIQRLHKSEENSKCFGGVILTNEDGLIVCKNTLDSRLQLAYQHMLPVIRQELFGLQREVK